MSLRWLNGETFAGLRDLFGISRASVCRCTQLVRKYGSGLQRVVFKRKSTTLINRFPVTKRRERRILSLVTA